MKYKFEKLTNFFAPKKDSYYQDEEKEIDYIRDKTPVEINNHIEIL